MSGNDIKNGEEAKETKVANFIRNIMIEDEESGKHEGRVHTRFPPEPNGYLHIGHAKSICINFGLAKEFGGKTNLRFDDTNPVKEDVEYVDSIKEDVRWLGFDWEDREYFASDYFDTLYEYAVKLIKDGKAYVDDLTPEEIRKYRGTLTEAGKESPYRTRSIEENLDLFERMKNGEFGDGEKVLRAKVDMAHGNMNMRDPAIYRIKHAHHHRTGDKWCIYPMYDFAHGQSDSIERITHSLCTLEFEDHRPLYDWLTENLEIYRPRQIEFARLNLSFTVLSKRKLLQLVQEGHVNGWNDPRMPTISGYRRRGFTPEAIRDFVERVGVAKNDSLVDVALLEHCLREDLNKRANRYMGVLDPLKLVITNYPDGQVEMIDAVNNPEDESAGGRQVPFSKEVYIEREDFIPQAPNKKYFRLAIGKEVRLKHAYYVTATDYKTDADGIITEVHCTYDPATKGGWSDDGRKVKGTLHWVSTEHAVDAEVRLYDRLFQTANPNKAEEGKTFLDNINPDSLKVLNAKVEPIVKELERETKFQFLRHGYFCIDQVDSTPEKVVINRTVQLKDSWAKMQKK